MRLPIENVLQEKMVEALAGIHAQLHFVLALADDKPARLIALGSAPGLAFKLPLSCGWLLIDEQSATVTRTNTTDYPEQPYAALFQSQAVRHAAERSASWSKGDRLAERAMQGILTNDRAAFQHLIRWAPLIETQVYSLAAQLTEILDALRPHVRAAIMEHEKIGTLSLHYWRFAGMLARATLLATTAGSRPWLQDTARAFTWVNWTPSFPLVRERNGWLAAIGARAAAECGPDVVPAYIDALSRSRHPLTAADAILGMTAIAYRHDCARLEVLDVFRGTIATRPHADMVAPELLPLIVQQAHRLLLSDKRPEPGCHFPLPPYSVDPTSFAPATGYSLLSQLPFALAVPTTSLIPGAGAPSVLPNKVSANAIFIRSWGPEPGGDNSPPRLH
ncbi:MAG TPA: hypothetical protein VF503_24135 [Sphingobium sp.]|uniref:hypothetical protein n=1 Tax=Sphingobium sp. TaxID=1912891 RepID=UPI002ED3DB30